MENLVKPMENQRWQKGAGEGGAETGHGYLKTLIKPLGKQHFELHCKPTPPRADPGVLDSRRQIHDEPLENLGKTMASLGCRGKIGDAAMIPLSAPGNRTRLPPKPCKTIGETAL